MALLPPLATDEDVEEEADERAGEPSSSVEGEEGSENDAAEEEVTRPNSTRHPLHVLIDLNPSTLSRMQNSHGKISQRHARSMKIVTPISLRSRGYASAWATHPLRHSSTREQ